MHLRPLSEKLLMIVLLLVGLSILQTAIVFSLPQLLPSDNIEFFMAVTSNSYLIADIIFGIVIFWLTKRMGLIAISIGLLSIILPTFGAIFYMLTTLRDKSEND
jgi:hypothetical protein